MVSLNGTPVNTIVLRIAGYPPGYATGWLITSAASIFRLTGGSALLTPFPAIRFYHPCTIANPVPWAHNARKKGGTILPLWCLNQMKRLPAGSIRLNRFLVGRPSKRLQGLLRKAHGVWRESSATTLGARRQERRQTCLTWRASFPGRRTKPSS
jgi:hypothetical protein